MRDDNDRHAGRPCAAAHGVKPQLAAHDGLPFVVRAALKEASAQICSACVSAAIERGTPIELVLSVIAEIEREEIASFSAQHEKRCGVPLPHVAAGVSIQRYLHG